MCPICMKETKQKQNQVSSVQSEESKKVKSINMKHKTKYIKDNNTKQNNINQNSPLALVVSNIHEIIHEIWNSINILLQIIHILHFIHTICQCVFNCIEYIFNRSINNRITRSTETIPMGACSDLS